MQKLVDATTRDQSNSVGIYYVLTTPSFVGLYLLRLQANFLFLPSNVLYNNI